ncbi:MAG TPA: Glu-tRNA(Gln) amidotransferase subunit GatE [Candidatus Edwardsbacteria bacterium]|nr:Glu-tRNA(Gln) amidotransferase subunit GatE [Candidatus Edwardsbacteria bacterium]
MPIDPRANHEATEKATGYLPRKQATQADYDRIGFMSGLEVHQQLLTARKLFCRCPAGSYQKPDDYDAELIRHMRPTLSELGEYDGTALMEFKTRKQIVYHIKSGTACTYEVDDTPPFPLNREALAIAIEIALLSRLNIVGEVHITRKQYLDGSIPTGFQRTAIIGVEGSIPLKHKTVRLIQLSLEEDSCREVSDVGHVRVYRTDRLGMPLIETVTYPDMKNPDEVREACDYIRFLNRSTGKVRTGIGAARQDVNVSCRGGTRVELKGVSHTKWIPELTHNECFRQWALLQVRALLNGRVRDHKAWAPAFQPLHFYSQGLASPFLKEAKDKGFKLVAVNLPAFGGVLSHFTQPGQCFADELAGRLKVVACIERPNLTCSEALDPVVGDADWAKVRALFQAQDNDAQLIFWGPEDDIKTARETIEERCRMAFEGVPNETRKVSADGTSVFERVLPGADRMYPDTDSKPIPLGDAEIERIRKLVPSEVVARYGQLKRWGVPEDCYPHLFIRNYYPAIERVVNELGFDPVFTGTVFGQTLKHIEGHHKAGPDFAPNKVYGLFKYVKEQGLAPELVREMLPVIYQHPKMDFESVLTSIGFKRLAKDEILSKIPFLREKIKATRISKDPATEPHWIMGQLRTSALGNIGLTELSTIILRG